MSKTEATIRLPSQATAKKAKPKHGVLGKKRDAAPGGTRPKAE